MAEQRRMSTRFRGEPPPKKRALTPTPPPPPEKHVKHYPKPAEPVEEGLPMKIKEARPLPTLSEPQDENLPENEYQSVSESGVLATAIEQSRHKWMNEGIFDRYWAKPSKKKGIGETTPQPEKSTMSRLGSCSMVIEPHAFEVTLYAVKEHPVPYQYPAIPLPPQTFSQYSPYPQNGSYVTPYGPPFTGTSTSDHRPPQQTSGQPSLPPFSQAFANIDARSPPPLNRIPTPTPTPAQPAESRRPSTSSRGSQESRLREGASTDPVIQMLATRAASDPRLKNLMKIVAAGSASPEQLAEFQSHIDELNALLKSPQAYNPPIQTDHPPMPASDKNAVSPPPNDNAAPQNTTPAPAPSQAPAPNAEHSPPAQQPPIKTEAPPPQPLPGPSQLPQLPPMRAYPPPPPPHPNHPKPEIQAIVFDFNGTGDRFLFPRMSILEYLPGAMQALVSFLIIRRGSSINTTSTTASTAAKSGSSKYYKGNQNYYQPVTMRLSASNARLLENLTKVVAPPEEVREYMDGIFDKMQPAESVYLPLRLPKGKGEGDGEGKGDRLPTAAAKKAMTIEEPLVKPFYEAPSSMMPLRA